MKKIISCMLLIVIVGTSSLNVFAMDKRVKASKHYVTDKKITASEAKKHKAWKKGYYKGKANGYITATQRHYANVALFVQYSTYSKYSGRKWGTGKVSAGTGWATGISTLPVDVYFSALYYGF